MIRTQHTELRGTNERNFRNEMAAFLSMVPGLGHFYKGYRIMGICLLLLGVPLIFFIAGIMALATLGLSLFLPFLYWGLTAWHAFGVKDHNRHHWFL